MRSSLYTLTLLLSASCRVDGHYVNPDGEPAGSWLKHIRGSGEQKVFTVALALDGSVFISGLFEQTIDLGGGPLMAVGRDLFVAKFAPDGQHIWSRNLSGGFVAIARQKLLSNGDFVIAGDFRQSVTLGSTTLNAVGDQDVFVARFSGMGDPIWARSGGTGGYDRLYDLSFDPNDNISACGGLSGNGSFFGSQTLSGANMWLTRITSGGDHSWSRAMSSGSGFSSECGVASMSDGDVVFAGSFNGSVSAGGPTLTSTDGSFDIYMARYAAADGSHRWSAAKGGSGVDAVGDVEASGPSIIITGRFSNSISFGGSTLTAQEQDAFVAKFDASNGSHQFSNSMGDSGQRVAVRPDGQVAAAGVFTGTASFGGTSLTAASTMPDPFVVDVDAMSGAVLSVRSVGGATIYDMATSAQSLVVGGSFNIPITVLNQKLTSEGLADGYVILFKR